MFGLRQKLVFGFGGLLVILVIVSLLSALVLRLYSNTLAQYLSENYRSVQYGQRMRSALERLDDEAERRREGRLTATSAPSAIRSDSVDTFNQNLALEAQNITLHPREDQAVETLRSGWAGYQAARAVVLDAATSDAAREAAYRQMMALSSPLRDAAQSVIDMNLDNMVNKDGQVKTAAWAFQKGMYALTLTGVLLAILFTTLLARSILHPLNTLTQSAREIERGNLDLVVKVTSRDEVGQLAEAFNSMAARLREFRRTDRAKLVRTQRTTQLAVNSLPDAIAIISPNGKVELANDAARTLFGIRPDAPLAEARVEGLAELCRRAAGDGAAAEPRGYEAAIQVLDASGQERFFLPQVVPIIDTGTPGGPPVGVTLVLADVTNLRRLDEMKSGMLSVVSHELKTPLTSIRMAVHLLLEERVGPLLPRQAELLVAAREDSDRLQQIIENLLDIGRMEAGRAMMDFQPIAPAELIRHSAEPLESGYDDRSVKLVVDAPADLPEVAVDPTRINHVLSNLLTNALKFTGPGGSVQVTATQEGPLVRFDVADTGSGIPPEYIGRLFERFYRVPGQGAQSGAGLGLAIAREIVDAHGGQLSVKSVEGRGSTFSFTLRVFEAPQRGTGSEATSRDAGSQIASVGRVAVQGADAAANGQEAQHETV